MSDELQIYIDGEYFPKSKAKISVYDHGFLYGDGVFEGIREYNGVVFKLKEHIDRLYRSAHAIMLKIPMSKDDLIEAVVKTLGILPSDERFKNLSIAEFKYLSLIS